jgi:hypothetical protein
MRKVTLTLAIALLFAGAAVLTPTRKPRAGPITSPVQRRASRRSNRRLAADGTLLPAWIRPRVRSVSMLVSSLLVNRGAKGGAVALAAPPSRD